jgi:Lon protease-like protein
MAHGQASSINSNAAIPVFDIPGFVLFPHTLVPFHVFEKRYGAMLDACLAERRLMVVAGRKPGWDTQFNADNEHVEIAGLGRILSDRRFHDGRYNIFVHCIARVQLVRTHQFAPYRIVDLESLDDVEDSPIALNAASEKMKSLGESLAREMGEDGGALSKILTSSDDPAVLSFRVAGFLLSDSAEKQEVLEMVSPYERCEFLASCFAERLMGVSNEQPAVNRWMN